MREKNKQSPDQLRGIAGFVMLIGIIIDFALGNTWNFSISASSSNTFMSIGAVGIIILGAIVIF